MISEMAGPGAAQHVFVIQPNPPIPWSSLLRVFAAMAAFVLLVGIVCAMAGLPLVLPFAGIEIVVLGAGFYLSARRGTRREVIRVLDGEIVFESGHTRPEHRESFRRPWTRVILEQDRDNWYPGRLLLRSAGRQVEIGRFLGEQERSGLARRLRRALDAEVVERRINSNSSIGAERCRGLEHEA